MLCFKKGIEFQTRPSLDKDKIMAKLHYSPWLVLDLFEAAERQRAGKECSIGASISVTKELYDHVFKDISSSVPVMSALKKITTGNISDAWTHKYPEDKMTLQSMTIEVTPCIWKVTPEVSTVGISLPVFIPEIKIEDKKIEAILRACIGENPSLQFRGHEVLIWREIKTRKRRDGRFDIVHS